MAQASDGEEIGGALSPRAWRRRHRHGGGSNCARAETQKLAMG